MKAFRLFIFLLIPFIGSAQGSSPASELSCEPDSYSPLHIRFITIETDEPVRLKLDNSNHQLEDISGADIRRMRFGDGNTAGDDVIVRDDHVIDFDTTEQYLAIVMLDPWICSKKAVTRELTFTYTTEHGTKGSLCVPITTDFHMSNDTIVRDGGAEYTYRRGELTQLRRFGKENVVLLELSYKKGKCVKAVEYDREQKTATTITYKDEAEIRREDKSLED
jgi:hypothetical protein